MNGANINDWSEDTVISCGIVDDVFKDKKGAD